MNENELTEIEIMAAYLDENTSLFCLGWSEELPIMDFVTKLYKAGCRIMPTGSVVLKVGKHNEALDEKTIEFFVNHNAKVRKETAKEILLYLLDGLKKQRARYSQEYDKWDAAQKDCDREDWKADYAEKREKANGYYLMADRAIGYIKKLAKEYGVEVEE